MLQITVTNRYNGNQPELDSSDTFLFLVVTGHVIQSSSNILSLADGSLGFSMSKRLLLKQKSTQNDVLLCIMSLPLLHHEIHGFQMQRTKSDGHKIPSFKLHLKLLKKVYNYLCNFWTYSFNQRLGLQYFITNLFVFMYQLVDCRTNQQYQAVEVLQCKKNMKEMNLLLLKSMKAYVAFVVACYQFNAANSRDLFSRSCQQMLPLTANRYNLTKWQAL